MRRIFARGGQAVIGEVEEPTLRRGEVLVRTAFSTVSAGTEMWILRKSAEGDAKDEEYPGATPWEDPDIRSGILHAEKPRRPVPGHISLGYSLAGVVEAVSPEVTDLAPGDRVACMGPQCAHHAEVVPIPPNPRAARSRAADTWPRRPAPRLKPRPPQSIRKASPAPRTTRQAYPSARIHRARNAHIVRLRRAFSLRLCCCAESAC